MFMMRYLAIMARPLQVYVDEGELKRLEAWSRKRGWTKSQTVRAALRALTASAEDDPLLAAAGLIAGLPSNLSANFNRRLEETFVAAPQTKVKRRRTKRGLRR